MKYIDDFSHEEIVQLFASECLGPLDGNQPIPNDIMYKLMIVFCQGHKVPLPPKKLFINLLRKSYSQFKYKDEVCFRAGIKPEIFQEDTHE